MRVVGEETPGHPLRFLDIANQSEKGADPALRGEIARSLSQALAVKLQRFIEATSDKVCIAHSHPGICLGPVERTEAYRPLETYSVVALIYFALSLPISRLVHVIERRQDAAVQR